MDKTRQGFWGLWTISFGFFGIQIGFALQNANVSRIFQSLGASIDELAILWIAAPFTGLVVQPLVGHFSDRTWTRMGRRRPWFLGGAILASLALVAMPNAPLLWMAAGLLWIMDTSFNVCMEPFRAFVGDMLDEEQRATGYAFQTAFIGAGAVLASLAPMILTQWFGVSNVAAAGSIPPSVQYAFYFGAAAMLVSVLWTVFGNREYPPTAESQVQKSPAFHKAIVADFLAMPKTMKQLAVVQLFSWSALFILWIFTTPIVTRYVFAATDTTSQAYNDGADWVGVLFAAYNGVAALWAFAMPPLTRRFGAAVTHMIGLAAGALGFLSFFIIRDPYLLPIAMTGIGIAWASILTMPFVILAGVLPQHKLGVYMGLFNMFVVLPQIFVAAVMGWVMRTAFPDEPILVMAIAAAMFAGAALSMLKLRSS